MDDCELCDGTGEVEITMAGSNKSDYFGCPKCIEREKDEELKEETAIRERCAKLLAETAVALKGEEEALKGHSWHDLPEVAAGMVAELTTLRAFKAAVEGQEPVARVVTTDGCAFVYQNYRHLPEGTELFPLLNRLNLRLPKPTRWATAPAPAQQTGWQPIETAPKDEAAWNSQRVAPVGWIDDGQVYWFSHMPPDGAELFITPPITEKE